MHVSGRKPLPSRTVPTVGDSRGKTKLQKEHTIGHKGNVFRAIGLSDCVVAGGPPAALEFDLGPRGRVDRDHTTLVRTSVTVDYVGASPVDPKHEARISKADPLRLAQQPAVHPLSRRGMGPASTR